MGCPRSEVSMDTPGVSIFQKEVILVTKSGDTPLLYVLNVKLLQQSGGLTLDTPRV